MLYSLINFRKKHLTKNKRCDIIKTENILYAMTGIKAVVSFQRAAIW